YEWIGIIFPDDVKVTVSFITPLAYYVEGMWKSLALDARKQWFPSNGKVALFEKDLPRGSLGRLWLFRPEQSTLLYANIPGYSRYVVSRELEVAPFAQVLDWTARTSEPSDMPDLLEHGIATQNCYCQRVYIYWHSRLFGPIRLELEADRFKPREYL